MISAIVLAAGASVRMNGNNKLMLPLNGKASVQIVVENILAAGVEEIIVVVGHEAEKVRAILESLPVRFVYNENHHTGMTSSIQKGVSIAESNGYMICLSDMPFITSDEYSSLKEFFEQTRLVNEACICVPTHKGRQGNPVIFSSTHREAILRHEEMEGCKKILRSRASDVYPLEFEKENILRDIDTPEDYRLASSENKNAS